MCFVFIAMNKFKEEYDKIKNEVIYNMFITGYAKKHLMIHPSD